MPVIVGCAGFRTNLTRLTFICTCLLFVSSFELQDEDTCMDCAHEEHLLTLVQGHAKRNASHKKHNSTATRSRGPSFEDVVADVVGQISSTEYLTRLVTATGNTTIVVTMVLVITAIFIVVLLFDQASDDCGGNDGQWKCRESCSRMLRARPRTEAKMTGQSQATSSASLKLKPTEKLADDAQGAGESARRLEEDLAFRPSLPPMSSPGMYHPSRKDDPSSPSSAQRVSSGNAASPEFGASPIISREVSGHHTTFQNSVSHAPQRPSPRPGSSSASSAVTLAGSSPNTILCNELVMPHCAAWFAFSLKQLETSESTELDVYGLSGKPLLEARVETSVDGHGRIEITARPSRRPTWGSLMCTAPFGADGTKKMQLFDKKGQKYGEIVNIGGAAYKSIVINQQGSQVALLGLDDSTGELLLVEASSGNELARASKSVSSEHASMFHNEPHLEVHVYAGTDPVLALLCLLGAILFGTLRGIDLPIADLSQGTLRESTAGTLSARDMSMGTSGPSPGPSPRV